MRKLVVAILLGACATLVVSAGAQAQTNKYGNSPNAKLCQKGGWENLVGSDGTSFADEGECVSYAARGGTLERKPTASPGELACAEVGGVYAVGSGDVLWTCTDFAATGEEFGHEVDLLSSVCFASGGGATSWEVHFVDDSIVSTRVSCWV